MQKLTKEKIRKLHELSKRMADDIKLYMRIVEPKCYPESYPTAPHTWDWAKEMQHNKFTAKISARKHLKSTTVYGFLRWKIFRMFQYPKNWEELYISFKQSLASYHIRNIKKGIQINPFFRGIQDLSPNSDRIMKYTWDGKHLFEVEPEGILSFKRGRHPDGVIADDILADPASELEPAVIDKINRVFKEDVMSLPKEGGELHLVGTAQHPKDIFFQLKENKEFAWSMNRAVINDRNEEVLWKELFPYKRLMQIRDGIGDKAYKKEYLCEPVWSAEAYLPMDLLKLVAFEKNRNLGQIKESSNLRVAGYDVGKHTHPSHVSVFEIVKGEMIQIFQIFLDHMDYNKQVEFVNEIIEMLEIDRLWYDATRGELEALYEQGEMDQSIWIPITFKTKNRHAMAAEFEKRVMKSKEKKKEGISLINNQRMLEQVSMMNNNLEAVETKDGHADSFWSIAMACSAAARMGDIDHDEISEAMDTLMGGKGMFQ